MYRDRRTTDQDIIRRLLKGLFADGYAINVDNGGEEMELSAPTADFEIAWGVIGEADMEHIYVYPFAGPKGRKAIGWVLLVFGNGVGELISDYTVNLESVLKPVNEYAAAL